jgi:hypothetical protein
MKARHKFLWHALLWLSQCLCKKLLLLIYWDLPQPNSVILRYQIGMSSEQSFCVRQQFSFFFLPPPMFNMSFGKRKRWKKKKNLTGFQPFFFLFLPGLMFPEWRGSVLIEPSVFVYLSWQLPFLLLPWENFGGLEQAISCMPWKDNAPT